MVPPRETASREQRIRRARNIEPKLSTPLKSKTTQRVFLALERVQDQLGDLLLEVEVDVLDRRRRGDDRKITVSLERERIASRSRILDGHIA